MFNSSVSTLITGPFLTQAHTHQSAFYPEPLSTLSFHFSSLVFSEWNSLLSLFPSSWLLLTLQISMKSVRFLRSRFWLKTSIGEGAVRWRGVRGTGWSQDKSYARMGSPWGVNFLWTNQEAVTPKLQQEVDSIWRRCCCSVDLSHYLMTHAWGRGWEQRMHSKPRWQSCGEGASWGLLANISRSREMSVWQLKRRVGYRGTRRII